MAETVSSEQGNNYFQMETVREFKEDVRCVLAFQGHTNLEKSKQVISDVRN